MLTASEIQQLVKVGEGYNVDFKRTVPAKVKEISEEVAGFANASGGYVLIGVDNDNQIIGAEIDNNKRSAIQDTIGEISTALRCDFYPVEVEGKKVGSGIPRMCRLMKEAGLPEPKFYTKGFFTVKFMKRNKYNRANGDRLNDREQKVIRILTDTPGLRTNELSSVIGVSIPTLSRTLKTLINIGLIEYRGAKKTGGYFIRHSEYDVCDES